MIKFRCKNCGQKLRVPEIRAGKKGRCPKCKNIVFVPKIEITASPAGKGDTAGLKTTVKGATYALTPLDVPQKDKTASRPAGQQLVSDKVSQDLQKLEERMAADKTESEPAPKRTLPWFIDVLLYPANLHGLTQIAVFCLLAFLLDLLVRFLLLHIYFGGIFHLILSALLAGYILYYFGYCVFDSSKGGRRAPNIAPQHTPDKTDFISQLILVLGCIAICFWPPAVYYTFTRQTGLIFWILIALGSFFFPMALLVGFLFDSFGALNPLSIARSICRTFLPYCGLILSFSVFGALVVVIASLLKHVPLFKFIRNGVYLYLLFIAAHLLGRFYWWHKDKLNWGL